MRNSERINRLEQRLNSFIGGVNERQWQTDHPPKFKIGDKIKPFFIIGFTMVNEDGFSNRAWKYEIYDYKIDKYSTWWFEKDLIELKAKNQQNRKPHENK